MAIPLRTDFDAVMARAAARKSKDGGQARRLLALAAIYDGASRTEAARIGGELMKESPDQIPPALLHGWSLLDAAASARALGGEWRSRVEAARRLAADWSARVPKHAGLRALRDAAVRDAGGANR